MIYNIVGLTGLILVLFVFVVLYITRPIHEIEDYMDEVENMRLHDELVDICTDLGYALDDYIIDRCMERAKYFGRKTSDMADFNSVIYELGLDNKLISELLTRIEGKNR